MKPECVWAFQRMMACSNGSSELFLMLLALATTRENVASVQLFLRKALPRLSLNSAWCRRLGNVSHLLQLGTKLQIPPRDKSEKVTQSRKEHWRKVWRQICSNKNARASRQQANQATGALLVKELKSLLGSQKNCGLPCRRQWNKLQHTTRQPREGKPSSHIQEIHQRPSAAMGRFFSSVFTISENLLMWRMKKSP
jgi:hypothetical protein